jgi:adenylate cyclase
VVQEVRRAADECLKHGSSGMIEQSIKQLIFKAAILLAIYLLMLANMAGWYYLDINFYFSPNEKLLDLGSFKFSFGLSREGFSGKGIEEFRQSFLKWIPLYVSLCLFLPFLKPLYSSAVIFVSGLLILLLTLYGSGDSEGLFLRFSLLALAVVFSVHVLVSFFTEHRDRQELTTVFSQYIPSQLARNYVTKQGVSQLQGKDREISVMFCDIQGFTHISEEMSPKELASLLHAVFTSITRVIHRNEGLVDKYMGDCVMALWGAPINDPLHTQNSLVCAEEIHDQLELLAPTFREKNWPEIKVGIGIAAGECVVGNMGSEFRVAYTAVGDMVNLAARLEKLTRHYGVSTIVTETVKEDVKQQLFRELDIVKLKGRVQHVKIYEPLNTTKTSNPVLMHRLKHYETALGFYRDKNWVEAERRFKVLHKDDANDPLYEWYLDSIAYYRENAPSERWRGQLLHTVAHR